ncbi:treacle protein isoform X2 [Candoia aspera]|uniref:treacle protein isoform X2 n=1 Tax=Candoia aspera TaxID=51853 RepID=UPI002FD7BE63
MAAAAREQKELLALMHHQLVQMGYERAAKELLDQSGQKTLPSSSVSLKEIIAQWKKTSSRTPKQKTIEAKRGTPVKIRIPDPKSSSESSEEEAAAETIKTNLPMNNNTKLRKTAEEESSSEDSDSSSEEEAVARKTVKNPVAGNKAEFLQLAHQNTHSVPGKGVAVAAVQAKGEQNASPSNKPLPPSVRKAGPNKGLSSKAGPPSQSRISGGQKTAQTALAKTAGSSESSSSTSESEEGTASTVVKATPSKPSLKKAESTSEDSSDDSDSEEGSKAPAVHVKAAVQNAQVSTLLVKKSSATAGSSTRNAVKVTPAKQTSVRSGNAKKSTESTDTSETSDSSDSEPKEPALVAQLKLSGKSPQASKAPVKNTASSPLSKAVSASALPKSTQKPPVTSLAKPLPPSKEAQSSDSSESSSESENETLPVPISQKRLPTPHPSVGTKQNQADQPGILPKAVSGALKGKEAQNKSSSSSDSEDETVPTPCKLPAPSAPKASPAVQGACRVKPQPPEGSRQKAQQSEDSSEDSSDDSDSEEDTAQKPAQVTQKPASSPMKSLTAKNSGITLGKPQPAGKGGTTPAKSGAAPVPEVSKSSETSSSDSSDSTEAEKPAKQMTGKVTIPSGKGVQTNLNMPNTASNKCQIPATKARGKEGQTPSQKAKPGQGQVLAAKSPGITMHKESSSDSSSDSEEEAEALTTARHPAQPATQQKQEGKKESESSSEESSDEEASQSLLTGLSSPHKSQASTVAAGPLLSKQSSGKASTPAVSAPAEASGKPAPADSTSSAESSSSNSKAEETVRPKAEIISLPSSGREAVAAKMRKGKRGLESTSSKPPPAKKAAAKAQSNGQVPGTSAVQLPESLTPLFKAHPGNKEQAAPQVSPGTQEDAHANPVRKAKTSKTGTKEKPSKKRKLAVGDTDPEVSKGKKLKMQSGEEMLVKKKKKKKKSKSSDSTKSSKKKNSKEKKADKKKKKSKNVERLDADGSQKKKKKKKKMDNLEEEA